mgnify:CR=1 FL=1
MPKKPKNPILFQLSSDFWDVYFLVQSKDVEVLRIRIETKDVFQLSFDFWPPEYVTNMPKDNYGSSFNYFLISGC